MLRVTVRACPLLVPLIEEGWLENAITDRVLAQYLETLVREGIDTLVSAAHITRSCAMRSLDCSVTK